jgi:crossover junction endodeoxyribonuclease RuvC
MRILGVDPGSNITGYGVVERVDSCIVHVAHGTIRTPAGQPLARRLAMIQCQLREAIEAHRPDRAAVESVFVSRNAASALVLGQARGAILATLGSHELPVDELAARQIKKAVTGAGAADKVQVQTMVVRLLGLSQVPAQDAADALAAAICRAQMGRLAELDVRVRSRTRRRRRLVRPGRTS